MLPGPGLKFPAGTAAVRGLVLLFALALAVLGTGQPRGALAGSSAASGGPQVTLAASSGDADSTDGNAPTASLVIGVTVDNAGGPNLSGLRIQSPVPAGTHVASSWLGQAGSTAGTVQGGSIVWDGLTLPAGGRLGPASYRLVADAGSDGATLFLQSSIQPQIMWTGPVAGAVTPPVLPLNGLWGEESLRRTVLPSGLTIFTQSRPDTPTVALQLAVRAGARDEDSTTCGTSYWLEHGHFLGTARLPDNQAVGRAILSVGGEFNASTGWESTQFWDLVPADKFDTAISTLSDQMLNSTYPQASFQREKGILADEVNLRADNPPIHAFDLFVKLVFQTSPLRHSPADVDCLATMTNDTVFGYLAQHYVTGNMVIAASGDLQHDDAVAKIARAFAGLPVGPRELRPAIPEPIETQPRMQETGDSAAPTTIRLGWPVPGDSDADWAAMAILSDILGPVGQRIAESVRVTHTDATDLDATYRDFSDAGALILNASAPAGGAKTTIGLLLAEVQRLRDGDVSDEDVQEAIRATEGSRAVDSELNLTQTGRAIDEAVGMLQSYDEVVARLRTVTPADVQRVAQTYLDPSNYSLVVLHQ